MTGWRGRRARLAAASLAVAALVLGVAALMDRHARPPSGGPSLSVHSTVDTGARGLYLWLAGLGYETSVLEYRPFSIDPSAKLLFVLAPEPNLDEGHAAEIVGWVERGGTLVASIRHEGPLLDKLGVRIEDAGARGETLVPLQPLFQSAPLRRVEAEEVSSLELLRPEWVPILGTDGPPGEAVGAAARLGSGRVVLLATLEPLSNAGLRKADNWALVPYFLAGVPAGSLVVFDEYHHGHTEHGTLGRRLIGEPWGWAILYSGALLYAHVALSGRRFGPPVAARPARVRRARSEYVSTIAGMLREGRHGGWLAGEYAAQVKRELGARFLVRTDLPAAEFAAAIARVRPEAARLAVPLGRLEGAPPRDDASIVAAIREVEGLRGRLMGISAGEALPWPESR